MGFSMVWLMIVQVCVVRSQVDIMNYPSVVTQPINFINDISRSGTFFRNIGSLSEEVGSYKIITNVNFNEIKGVINILNRQAKNFLMSFEQEINKNQSMTQMQRIQSLSWSNVQETVSQILASTQQVEDHFLLILRSYEAPRLKGRVARGLADFIGLGMKYLFGVSTTRDLEKMKTDTFKSRSDMVKIVHAQKELLSVAKLQHLHIQSLESHQRTLLNATQILTEEIYATNIQLRGLKLASAHNFIEQKIDSFKLHCLSMLNRLENQLNLYFAELQAAKEGVLTPSLIDPQLLQDLLSSVRSELPDGFELPHMKPNDFQFHFYNLITTQLVTLNNGDIALMLDVPLIKTSAKYSLFHVSLFNVPLVTSINTTSRLNIQDNAVYAIHATKNTAFSLPFDLLEECHAWKKHYICPSRHLDSVNVKVAKCLREISQKVNLTKTACSRSITTNDEVSIVRHLIGRSFGYSIRGYLNLKLFCRTIQGTSQKEHMLNGMGEFQLPEGCELKINNVEVKLPFIKTMLSGKRVLEKFSANAISEVYLSKNLAWRDIQNITFRTNLTQLKNLEKSLKKEEEFQPKDSELNSKTIELINRTRTLIDSSENAFDWVSYFETPSSNDILLWGAIGIIIMVQVLIYFKQRMDLERLYIRQMGVMLHPIANNVRNSSRHIRP